MITTFLDPKFVEHEVAGKSLKFYPATIRAVFKLRKVAKPLAQGLSYLFASGTNDRGMVTRQVGQGDDAGYEQIVEAINPELAKTRSEEREKAVEQVMSALLEPSALEIVEALIKDSLRDDTEWTKSLSIMDLSTDVLAEFLRGLAKANFQALPDPLAKRLAPESESPEEPAEETVGSN